MLCLMGRGCCMSSVCVCVCRGAGSARAVWPRLFPLGGPPLPSPFRQPPFAASLCQAALCCAHVVRRAGAVARMPSAANSWRAICCGTRACEGKHVLRPRTYLHRLCVCAHDLAAQRCQ